MSSDTIVALATPAVASALAIVRVSGNEAASLLQILFVPHHPRGSFASHHLYYGQIIDPEREEVIDEVLVSLMRGPHSFTGEDVVEIYCHGGTYIPQRILSLILSQGARLAERGEFTRRAFLNGRLDLTQAEATAEMIATGSKRSHQVALRHLQGDLKQTIDVLVNNLEECLAWLEASIDFGEDVDHAGHAVIGDVTPQLRALSDELQQLVHTYRQGRVIREGAAIVILGKPNVGKSSLLNCLLGRHRAIVTPLPGTTRDFLEEMLEINGIVIRIIDTAGLHHTTDAMELAGITLAWEKLAEADMVLFLCDGSRPWDDDDRAIMDKIQDKIVLPVINKIDLPLVLEEDHLASFTRLPVRISAKNGVGIEAFKQALAWELMGEEGGEGVMITQLRHYHCLERAVASINRALDVAGSSELASEEIREAIGALGEIIGTTTPPDILDRIFSSFCVGK